MEVVVCNKCGMRYDDKESVEMVKKWLADGYSPCPILPCRGRLEIKEVTNDPVRGDVQNQGV